MKYLFYLIVPWMFLFSFNAIYSKIYGKGLYKASRKSCTYACSGYPTKAPAKMAKKIISGRPFKLKSGNCRHQKYSLLPSFFTGDRGLYGKTIRALMSSGGGSSIGYGIVNLLFFCLIWPGIMFGMFVLGMWQRKKLRQKKGG